MEKLDPGVYYNPGVPNSVLVSDDVNGDSVYTAVADDCGGKGEDACLEPIIRVSHFMPADTRPSDARALKVVQLLRNHLGNHPLDDSKTNKMLASAGLRIGARIDAFSAGLTIAQNTPCAR